MDSRLVLAWLHLLALGTGLAGVWARARALRDFLRDPDDERAMPRALVGDTWWGVAAIIWITTGVWRLLGSTDHATAYYMSNELFILKMALLVIILLLEVLPMATLIKWRMKRVPPTRHDLRRMEAISYIQCALVIAMVMAATAMARGYGSPAGPRAVVPTAQGPSAPAAAGAAP